jgi:hypothetical protein
MKKQLVYVLILATIGFTRCKEEENDNIFYSSINKQYIFTRDVKVLEAKTDEVSQHIDSIISGLIDVDFVSTGSKTFDLDNDNKSDLGFEIIDLNKFNINKLPASFDSLAARVLPSAMQILDNSTYHYADALDIDQSINDGGKWTEETCVLGTFMNAGKFNGRGEKYLGIRLVRDQKYYYGWIKLNCSLHNDTLKIIEYAYNQTSGKEIKAGQKE